MSAMSTMTRAYSITAERLAAETEATGGDPSAIDVSKVVALDDLELRDLGPRDVQLKILAASAEHNIDHAATADTINIAEARGGKMYPGQLGPRRGARGRSRRHQVRRRRHRRHPLQRRARRERLPAAHLGLRPARVDRLVQRAGRRRGLAAHQGAARLRAEPVGDGGAAAAGADGVPPVASGHRHLPGQGPLRASGHPQRPQLRRRRRRAVPHAGQGRGPQRLLLRRFARSAATRSRSWASSASTRRSSTASPAATTSRRSTSGARSSPTARTCTSSATCSAARCSTPASPSRPAAA